MAFHRELLAMNTTANLTSLLSTAENTSTAERCDEQAMSTKADKDSQSFLEALSPWSARSKVTSDVGPVANNKEAKACAALVKEVFRPREQQKFEPTGEAALLPRLLDRMSLSVWSQTPPKSLSSEIQSLRGQQNAAAKLLEEVEKETDHINNQLKEKTRLSKLQGSKSVFGLACNHCGPTFDVNEIDMQPGHSRRDGTIELRPVLRNRVKECEQALVERDTELRQLRHEIQLLRSESEMIRHAEKDALLERPVDAKTSLLQRYGAAFSFVDESQMKVAFLAWHHHVQRRASRERMMKRTSRLLAADSSQQKAIVFASWQALVRDKRAAQRLKQERQRLTIGQSYAAKFAMQSASTTTRAIVIEWWRISKESALRKHIAAAQTKREAVGNESTALMLQKQGGAAADKACCALM